jgi:hypothetical protein
VYNSFDQSFTPYKGTSAAGDSTYDFKANGTFPDINPIYYINNVTGSFALKIEAQSSNNFEFVLNYMALETYYTVNTNEALIIVLLILLGVAVFIFIKILQRSGGIRRIQSRAINRFNRRNGASQR